MTQGMANDPPRRGPSQQEGREDGNSGAGPQSWLERRLRGLCQDDFEGGLRIYCTSNLEPPEAFRDVWHVISEESDLSAGPPMLSEADSAELHTILVFCNHNKHNEVKRLCDIITNIEMVTHFIRHPFIVYPLDVPCLCPHVGVFVARLTRAGGSASVAASSASSLLTMWRP